MILQVVGPPKLHLFRGETIPSEIPLSRATLSVHLERSAHSPSWYCGNLKGTPPPKMLTFFRKGIAKALIEESCWLTCAHNRHKNMYVDMINTYIYIQYTHTHTYIYICVYICTPLKINTEPWKNSLFQILLQFCLQAPLFFFVGFEHIPCIGTHNFRPEYDMQPWEGQHFHQECFWKSENLKRE